MSIVFDLANRFTNPQDLSEVVLAGAQMVLRITLH